MVTIETINPRRVLPKKCDVCGRNPATKEVVFDYGFKLHLCSKDKDDLKQALKGE